MKFKTAKYILLAVLAVVLAASCSTTRALSEGEYRLARNTIRVTNSDSFSTNGLYQYVKQQPNNYFIFGWNPFLNVYNWVDSDDDSGWARFCRKIGAAPVVYSPEAVESTIGTMEDHLEYLGYYNSKVSSNVRFDRRKVYVDYDIALGKRYVIDSLSFKLPQRGTFAQDFMDDIENLGVRTGDFLSEAALEEETERGAAHFRDLGYFGFTKNFYVFEADTISVPGRTFLEMRVNEYTRNETEANAEPIRKFTIGDVTISHSKDLKFKDSILRNLNTITPGQTYSEANVSTTYSRLSALRLFNSVGIEMNQADTCLVDCSINLSQSKLQGFKANLEASSNSTGLVGVSPQLSFYNKNLFHGGEWLNLSFMGNFQFKFNDPAHSNEFGVSAGLTFPRFLGLPYRIFKGPNIPRTEINASYNYQNRPEYTRNIFSTSFGYTGTYRRLSYQLYPLQVNVVSLDDMDPVFYENLSKNPFMRYAYQNHFDTGVGGTIYITSGSESKPSSSSAYMRLSTDLSGNVLGIFKPVMKTDADGAGLVFGIPFSQYVRGEITLGRTWTLGKNSGQAIATRLLGGLGYAYGNSSALPFEKQFYAGGANSMRGWQARTLGPGRSPANTSFIIPSQTGDLKLEANVEYRFNMFWKLEGALFLDAGNVWTTQFDDEVSGLDFKHLGQSIAADWGFGARVDLNFLILRLDMGMKLHDPVRTQGWLSPGEWLKRDGFAIHFGVGYPF